MADTWEVPGGAAPLYLDQNEAQTAEKNFFKPTPLILGRVWITAHPPPPPLSEGLDPPLYIATSMTRWKVNMVIAVLR